ncbi:F-box/LRR-repeat protein At3g59190-like [Corylus avellana]|uniref:F-box/LRR-repeat protein At3g59190-like n=1 Tax=Corylus avellana TaxID=13451 RepID=UPI001E1F05D8|nr:F-box/LRR-repeat protein At3g59190-like [Corylus avellana]
MEANSLIQKPIKKQKLNVEQDIDGNSNCLGNLPEEILLHILSFLRTEDAVRTSVLCKRWEYLWASIPNLDFNLLHASHAKRKLRRPLFMKFVDKVFCLRDSSVIERFSLCCDVLSDASRVNTWISAAVRHNVQELFITLENIKREFSLPYCLFTSKTLTSLDLYMSCIFKLPSTICFSNLKVLNIGKVTFSDEYLTQQFFSGLPVLEELELNRCSWVDLKVVRISAPKLHSMSIFEFECYGDGCQFMIFGVGLKNFNYCGCLLNEYCLYESFSLEKASIHLGTNDTSEQIAHRVHKLLTGLSNVQFLRLSSKVVKVLRYAAELLPHMPMFNNLVSLMFNVTEMSIDLSSEALLKILQRSPCLENLKFWTGGLTSNCEEEDDRILDPVPSCFLSHLKRIKVDRYDGDENRLSAIKILLKKAVVLEKIVIFFSVFLSLENRVKFCKQLIELPRGSHNCKIVVKWYDCSPDRSTKCKIVLS